jgi:hypothetical protein
MITPNLRAFSGNWAAFLIWRNKRKKGEGKGRRRREEGSL